MMVSESVARDLLRLLVWYPARWLVLALPPRAGLAVLRAMGDIHHALSRGTRARLLENLARMRPPGAPADPRREREAVREYFRNHYIDRLFIFIIPIFNDDQPPGNTDLVGCQANTGLSAHGFDHIIDQSLDFGGKFCHLASLAPQDRVR